MGTVREMDTHSGNEGKLVGRFAAFRKPAPAFPWLSCGPPPVVYAQVLVRPAPASIPPRTSRRISPPGVLHRIPRCSPVSVAPAVADARVPGPGDALPNRVGCGERVARFGADGRGDRAAGAPAMRPASPRKMFSMRSACSFSRANDRGSSSPPSPNCNTAAASTGMGCATVRDGMAASWKSHWLEGSG